MRSSGELLSILDHPAGSVVIQPHPTATGLPAGELEAAVREALTSFLIDSGRTRELVRQLESGILLRAYRELGGEDAFQDD